MISAHRLLCCCLPLLFLSSAASANPGVTAGFQLAPYSGFNLGLEWKDSPQLSYAAWISQGRISLDSEKGEALGITGGIKYFPFESSLYLFTGLNATNYEFTDDEPSNTALSKTENTIAAQTVEFLLGYTDGLVHKHSHQDVELKLHRAIRFASIAKSAKAMIDIMREKYQEVYGKQTREDDCSLLAIEVSGDSPIEAKDSLHSAVASPLHG